MPGGLLTFSCDEPLSPVWGGGSSPLWSWIARQRRRRDLHTLAYMVRQRWRDVCSGAELARTIPNATGGCEVWPEVCHVHLGAGGALTLTVRLLPGQLPADLAGAARRLAFGMGAAGVRVQPFRGGFVRVALLPADPLAGVVAPLPPVGSALDPLTLGVDETGEPVTLDLATAAHLVVQGATGSGKSVGLYSLLGQLADAPDVRVTGTDPTGLLLAPWVDRWADVPAPVLGTTDPLAYLLCLDGLVREMDRRIGALPAGRDSLPLGAVDIVNRSVPHQAFGNALPDISGHPVILVVLEEHPGALRILDATDKKLGAQYRALVSRLLAEGRKAGVRVVLLTQRADAAIIGAYERGQASHRVSYRVDSLDAVRMLHPDISPELAAGHANTPAGVALASVPGRPLLRMRSPLVSYEDYCRAVAGERVVERQKVPA